MRCHFFTKELHAQLVAAGERVPVHVSQVVAGFVTAVVAELQRRPGSRAKRGTGAVRRSVPWCGERKALRCRRAFLKKRGRAHSSSAPSSGSGGWKFLACFTNHGRCTPVRSPPQSNKKTTVTATCEFESTALGIVTVGLVT